MIQLEEIRLRESAPNIGVAVFANRRETSSFRVGVDNVISIMLDAGMITVVARFEDAEVMLGMPLSACRWWKFAELEAKPEDEQTKLMKEQLAAEVAKQRKPRRAEKAA